MIRVVLLALAATASPQASLEYFSHVRDVTVSNPARQNYLVVDGKAWEHARRDLGDARLYQGNTQIPYALKKQEAAITRTEEEAKILNLGTVNGGTEFDLKVSNLVEYDRVNLQIAASNFVSTASVYGVSSPGVRVRTELGSYTIYDLTKEGLGSNSVLKLPDTSFRFLHVRLAKSILPEQLKSATVSNYQEKKAAWTPAGSCQILGEKNKYTNISCHVPANFPLARVEFKVSGTGNFRRSVTLMDSKGAMAGTSSISRVRLTTEGSTVTTEELGMAVSDDLGKDFTISVSNGDDPPLGITAVQPLAVEHRIYFNPAGNSTLQLYYGDAQLDSPSYDYAKLFQEEGAATQAQLGGESANPAFHGRPDQRPWSERHSWILWIAMLCVIGVLAVLALRGFRNKTPSAA